MKFVMRLDVVTKRDKKYTYIHNIGTLNKSLLVTHLSTNKTKKKNIYSVTSLLAKMYENPLKIYSFKNPLG